MSGGALGSAAAGAVRRPTIGSVTSSTFLLAGSQALGILLEPTGVKRGTFNDFAVNPGEASDTVPYIAGTVETVPHLITYFDFHSKKVKNDAQISQMLINAGLSGLAGYIAGGGSFGLVPDPPTAYIGLAEGTIFGAIVAGLGQLRTASYRYYCGFLYGICHGPIDAITAVKVDERIVSNGGVAGSSILIDDPSAWGGDHVDGGVYATCDIIPGHFWPQQLPNTYLVTQVSNAASFSGKAMFLMRGFTGATESGYFAATPQGSPAVRPLKLRVKRLPDNLGVTAYHDINGDANIAECCFEWLTSPVFGVKKLPLSKIDVASFQLGAQTHHTRNLGISVEMNSDVDVESALDKFTDLGGSIIYGGFRSGTIRYKVIERNYSIPSLPVFRRGPDGSPPEAYNVIRVSGFTPGSWANTANDQAFTYLDRDNNYLKTTRYMQDIANRMLTGRVRSLAQEIDGVSNGATAAFIGTRELRAGAYPRPPLTLVVNRDGYLREPGDVIKYIDNVDNFVKVLRITEVQKLATDNTAEITLNCVEDQYGVGAAAYSPFVPTGFHLTMHLHLGLEDDLNELGDVATVLPGLKDSIAISLAVFTPVVLSDDVNNLTDSIALQVRTALSFSDSISLSDAVVVSAGSLTGAGPGILDLEADAGLSLSDNDPVVTWLDQSGANRDGTGLNDAPAGRPIFKAAAGPGGRPCIRSTGGTGAFERTGFSLASDVPVTNYTMFAIVKPTASPAHPYTITGGGAGCFQWRIDTDLKPQVVRENQANLGKANTALSTSAFQAIAVRYDGSTLDFWLGGSPDGSISVSSTQTNGISNVFGWNGASFTDREEFIGDFCRGKVFDSALSDSDVALEFAAILSRWGV